jgi:hypothetical protein
MKEFPAAAPAPTLVNTIQQQWGLTKKKIYTAQTAREPFIRDERVDDQHTQAPNVPASPTTLPTRDPRLGRTKSWRNKPSPIDLSSRRPVPYPRRSSQITPLSSPSEMNFPSPVSSISAPMATTPLDHDMFCTSVSSPMSPVTEPVHASQASSMHMMSPTAGPLEHQSAVHGFGEPSWHNTYTQASNSPLSGVPYSPPFSSPAFNPPLPNDGTSYLPNMPPPYSLQPKIAHPPQGSSAPPPIYDFMPLSSRLLEAASMDGNVPFIFSEEKERQSKALLKAAGLQEIPLPVIVAAARERKSMSPNLTGASPAWPLHSPSGVVSSPTFPPGPGACVPPHMSGVQYSSPEPLQYGQSCTFETNAGSHVPPGHASPLHGRSNPDWYY